MFSSTRKYNDTAVATRRTPLSEKNRGISSTNSASTKTTIKKTPAILKEKLKQRNANKLYRYHGWSSNVVKKIKDLPKIIGDKLKSENRIEIVTLDTNDLTASTRCSIKDCIQAISLNNKDPTSTSGWCERRPAQFDIPGHSEKFCTEMVIGDKFEKNVLEDESANRYNVAIFIVRSSTDPGVTTKEMFLQKMRELNAHDLTYWFATDVCGFALLNDLYQIKTNKGTWNSVYIILTCTSQDTTFTINGQDYRATLLGSALFNAVYERARQKGYDIVSLRAASQRLISIYHDMGFKRSINAKLYAERGNEDVQEIAYDCEGKGKEAKHTITIPGGVTPLQDVDKDVVDDGYFMTREV